MTCPCLSFFFNYCHFILSVSMVIKILLEFSFWIILRFFDFNRGIQFILVDCEMCPSSCHFILYSLFLILISSYSCFAHILLPLVLPSSDFEIVLPVCNRIVFTLTFKTMLKLIYLPQEWNRIFSFVIKFFLIFLFWNNFRLIENLQNYYREFPYTLHSASSNVNILLNHNTITKTRKLTLCNTVNYRC